MNSLSTSLRRHLRLLGVLVFLGTLLIVFELSGLKDHFSLAYLQGEIRENKLRGLSVFVLLFVLGNLIQIPGVAFLAAAVLTLGETLGGLATYIAACISCVVTFLTIRSIGGDALRRLDNALATRIFAKLDARPVMSMVLLRILFQTAPALNYSLALSGTGLRPYLAATLLGLPLPILLYCVFFDYLARNLGIS